MNSSIECPQWSFPKPWAVAAIRWRNDMLDRPLHPVLMSFCVFSASLRREGREEHRFILWSTYCAPRVILLCPMDPAIKSKRLLRTVEVNKQPEVTHLAHCGLCSLQGEGHLPPGASSIFPSADL